MTRFVRDKFDEFKESTIGAAFITKTVQQDPLTSIKFEIWDTAGQERYKSLAPMYYRNSQAAIVVFDITDDTSFSKAQNWINELRLQLGDDGLVIKLVGNKKDLKNKPSSNVVDESKIQEFTKREGVEFLETSAKTGEGVKELFDSIANDLPAQFWNEITEGEDIETTHQTSGTIDLNTIRDIGKTAGCNC